MVKTIFTNILKFVKLHKIIVGIGTVVLVAVIIFGFKLLNKTDSTVNYITVATEKGTLIISVSGSGQVSAVNEVAIKAKVSGDVLYVPVKVGDEVKKGSLIAQLDDTDGQKSVRDAQNSLDNAKLSLEKLMAPPSELSLLQAEHSLEQAQESKETAEKNLAKAYEDGFKTVSDIVLGLPSVMSVFSKLTPNQWANTGNLSSDSVWKQYNDNLDDYQEANRYSDTAVLDALILETYNTTKSVDLVIKATDDSTYIGRSNTYLSSITTLKDLIKNYKDAIVTAERSIAEKTASLEDLKAGPDELDIKSQQSAITQKESALADAKENLNEYYITAPFTGIIAQLNVHTGDSVDSLQSYGTVATLISNDLYASVTLNEVDAANVKAGQKAMLTFDAIEGLDVVGQVDEIDAIGTVSQGVVSYNVKIAFATTDVRIKSGMSVSATIITDSKTDVLLIPNAALKSQGDVNYVQVLENNAPVNKTVEIGLVNDDYTEITSGLTEGDKVITKTVSSSDSSSTANTSTKATSSGSLLQELNGGTGGGMRMGGPGG
ncbi:MAG TPA: efflux RND transporter periplasmic adaptor subunit [Candidatus Paceibacterota bacterium]|nr:efflux RND transporter periplasmic adaptor subunit [Candidatus Paceibacterota bacterium]